MTIFINLLLVLGLLNSVVSFQPPTLLRSQTSPPCAQRRTSTLFMSEPSFANQDDPVLQLPLMEAELASSDISKERKLELQEEIANAKTAAEFGVRSAQLLFYEAFSNQDEDAMRKVWSTDNDSVRCVHPGMESLNGTDEVMKSWSLVFRGPPFPIEPLRVKIEICGKTALCSCIEKTSNGGKLEALNVYRREGGSWKMTLHMASPIVMRVSSAGSSE